MSKQQFVYKAHSKCKYSLKLIYMLNLDCIFRILEFESTGIPVGNKEVSCEVELWDCSGDQKYVFIFSGILK